MASGVQFQLQRKPGTLKKNVPRSIIASILILGITIILASYAEVMMPMSSYITSEMIYDKTDAGYRICASFPPFTEDENPPVQFPELEILRGTHPYVSQLTVDSSARLLSGVIQGFYRLHIYQ